MDTVRVDLHTHTIFSDGGQTPEALALSLVDAGVRFAALTDHDTLEGLTRFSAVLARSGIPCLPGVELTTWFGDLRVHLVAYGFDPDDRALAATLVSMRHARNQEVHSIADSLRKAGSRRPAASSPADPGATSSAPDGTLGTADAIALVHQAGGRAFLAHPLVYETEAGQLEDLVVDLVAAGLDGIEAVYPQFTTSEQADLRRLARAHDALATRAILPRSSRDEIVDVVDLLLQLRLETQMAAIRAGGPPTGSVELASLGHVRRESLRQAFALIAAIQKQASHEFPEGG